MDALLLTDPANIDYLTGFQSSNLFVLRMGRKHVLFTDGRYLEKAKTVGAAGKARVGKFEVMDMGKSLKEAIAKLHKKHRWDTVQFEASHLTVAQFQRFKSLFPKVKWTKDPGTIEMLRALKTGAEIKKMETAQRLAEQVFYSAKKRLTPGVTELALAQFIKTEAYAVGADEISFEPIVAFGPHSSVPHHQNTFKKLNRGEPVLIDMGMKFGRYCSDMTRMVFTKSPTKDEERIYQLVLEAQEAPIRAMKPGVSCKTLDQIARKILRQGDHEQDFLHSLGHGIGLEVHEMPNLSSRSTEKLKAGMVVTSEPGVYLPGKFGVRIEDMILITPTGHRNLTRAPKALRDCILR